MNFFFYLYTIMDQGLESLKHLVEFGYNVRIIMLSATDDDKKSIKQLLEDEYKRAYIFTSDEETFKTLPLKLRVFELDEYNKKKIKSVFGRFNINVLLDYRKDKNPEIHPAYIGLFPNLSDLHNILVDEKLVDRYTQDTPLHVTVEYLGGKLGTKEEYPYGRICELEITGYSENKAGICLIAKPSDELSGNHITLGTNEKFTPTDVGKEIAPENIKNFEKPYIVKAVLAAMY